jgi:hypothetical protein
LSFDFEILSWFPEGAMLNRGGLRLKLISPLSHNKDSQTMSLQTLVEAKSQPGSLSLLKPNDLAWTLEPSFATEGQT